MDAADIALVPTDDLIEELLRRVDHGVIALVQDVTVKKSRVCRHWKGENLPCVGLCESLSLEILDDFNDRVVDEEEEEEV